jgi:DNA-binding NarL/FixJ family response regulator
MRSAEATHYRPSPTYDGFSKRELTVLTHLQDGKSNKEISAVLGISPRTVQKHLQRIYQHLRVQTRAEAIVQTLRREK